MFQNTHRAEQILQRRYPWHELMTSNHSQCWSTLASFPSDIFYGIWTQQRRSVSPYNLSTQNFENFATWSRFSKTNRKNCSQKFDGLRLEAVITPQWLPIDGNFRPNWPSTVWLVSIFTVRINAKSLPWTVRSVHTANTHTQQCRGYRRHFFANRVINIWNFLPKDVLNFNTLCSFKSSLNSVDFSRFLMFSWFLYCFMF